MTGTPPPSFTPAELEYLEGRAAAIGQRGTKADQVMARFIKGGVAGLRDLSALVGLAKGDAADDMPAKDDETEGEDSNTEDTGDNVVKGSQLDMDLATNVSTVHSDPGNADRRQQRVRALFVPGKKGS